MFFVFVFRVTTIVYSPANEHLEELMQKTAQKLGLTVQNVTNAEAMELLLQDELTLVNTLGSVQFDDSLSDIDSLPRDLYAAIRFPREMRSTSATSSWMTNLLFPQIQFAGPRSPTSNFTASPGKSLFCVMDLYLK